MSSVLRYLEFLSLGTWVGSILYLSLVVAPGAFATLASRDLAGAVVAMALGRLHILGLIAGLMYLAARVALARSLAALASPAALVVILMIVLTLVSQYWVSSRMAHLRIEMGSMDRAADDHPSRLQFNRLHRVSVQLEVTVLVLGLAALFFTLRNQR